MKLDVTNPSKAKRVNLTKKLEVDPRRKFTAKQCVEIFQKAGGRCDLCGRKLFKRSQWTAGHIIDWALGGRTEVENAQVECNETCSKATHKVSTGRSAKAKRQAGETGQQARRERNGSRLQSRGFDKSLTKGFDNKVRKRK